MHHMSGLQVCAPAVCGQEEVGSQKNELRQLKLRSAMASQNQAH